VRVSWTLRCGKFPQFEAEVHGAMTHHRSVPERGRGASRVRASAPVRGQEPR